MHGHLDTHKYTSVKFISKCKLFYSRKCFSNYHLQNVCHFVQASMCQTYKMSHPYFSICCHVSSGTFELGDEEEEEIYEVINVSKIKAHTPNLRIVNLYGISFVDDTHVELLSSNCIHLEALSLNFCLRVKGHSFKALVQRCRKLRALLLQHCSEYMCDRWAWFPVGHYWDYYPGALSFNSLLPSDATWWDRSGSTFTLVMACCLMAPSHYLNQFWLIISKVLWHSSKGHFTENTQGIYRWYELKIMKITYRQVSNIRHTLVGN